MPFAPRRPSGLSLGLGLLACFGLLAFDIGKRGLFESSEGRYGSLAAHMIRTGDWLIPHLNGVKRFEKPPLAIWAMAGSVRLLGESELALRLPGVLAALLGVAVAYAMALVLAEDAWEGPWAALFVVASPLYFGLSKALTTDIYLSLFSALTLLFWMRGMADEARRGRWLSLAAVAAAFGFLTKGPVIWMLTLVPIALEMAWSRRQRELLALLHPARILLFLLIAAPWFLVVGLREPGVFAFWIGQRTAKVLVSSKGLHPGPWYYFVPVFLLGFLPAGAVLLARLFERGGPPARPGRVRLERLLLCAVGFPFLMFSASASKLATYILPLVIPTAVLAAWSLGRPVARRGAVAGGLILIGMDIVVVARVALRPARRLGEASFPEDVLRSAFVAVILLFAAGCLAVVLSFRRTRAALCALALGLLASGLFAVEAACAGESLLGSARNVALAARSASERTGAPIVCYRGFVRSLPFYVGHDVYVAHYYQRPKLTEEEWEAVALENLDDVGRLVSGGRRALFITEPKYEAELAAAVGALRPLARSRDYVLYGN